VAYLFLALDEMTAWANLLLSVVLLLAVFGVVWIIALLSPHRRRSASGTEWGKLIVGVLATTLGIRTLITGHIGHWLYSPEMSASDGRARAIGVVLLVMGFMALGSWLNQRRKARGPDKEVSDDAT
jgi:hypothetical protein